jgi:hypothetical protein
MGIFLLTGCSTTQTAEKGPPTSHEPLLTPRAASETPTLSKVAALKEQNRQLRSELDKLRLKNQQLNEIVVSLSSGKELPNGTATPNAESPTMLSPGARGVGEPGILTTANPTPSGSAATRAVDPDPSALKAPGAPLTHWLTTKSGRRHNKECQYYKTTKGRECGPEDGEPCKICGG